jgi:chromosome segregation protein
VYLKRLDVQGFKSFANKTTIEFGSGITCVIGPNGTGKTNVADALRWVLGEHASRTIRARKTEDVIFAGSEKRAAMGVAEVNISLDNEERWLPIDFGEVVVSRRAYRSGENEYYINGSRVRLRDVVDLFMRAQVGQNSYAFMGQGMVEQALSLRPEDRRSLIEEAADVRVYRVRLEEAQHRLKGTRDNLERVHLLVSEIEPRINQLQRQAGRAARYKELAHELAASLHVWYAHQWRAVNEQLLAAEAALDQRREEFEQAQADHRACEDGLAQLRAAIDERREEIATREARLRTVQDYVRDLERRVALDGERIRLLSERLEELSTEMVALRQAAGQPAAGPDGSPASDADARSDEARERLASLREELAAAEQVLLRLQRSVMERKHSADAARAAAAELERRIAEGRDETVRLRREAQAATGERRKAIGELASWARDYARMRAEVRSLGPRLEGMAAEQARLAASAEAARPEHVAAEEELRVLTRQLETMRVRLDLLETLEVRPQAPDAAVRSILEAGGIIKRETVPEEIELRGVIGLVGHIIKVPPGLENAIQAALAENLFAVVVEREADVRLVVELLLAGDSGRATLFALDNFQEVRPLNLIKERGVIGVASQLVKCDSRYRKLVDTLLGRAVIVEDMAQARRFIRRGLANSVATLDGVLIRPVGSVAAGTIAGVSADFVRERDLDELPREIARIEPLVAEREASLREIARRVDDEQRRAEEMAPEVEALRVRKARADAEFAAAQGRLTSFRASLPALTGTAARAEQQLARIEASIAGWVEEREQRLRDAEEAMAAGHRDREALLAAEERRERTGAAIAEQAAALAELDALQRSTGGTTHSERTMRERITEQLGAKEQQQERIRGEIETVRTRLAATEREMTERSTEVEGLTSELGPAREELAQFVSRERALTGELSEANGRLHTAERTVFEAETHLRAKQDEVVALRESLDADGFVTTDDGDVVPAPRSEPEPEPEPVSEAAQPEASSSNGDASHLNGGPPGWLRSDDDGPDIPPVRGGSAINPTEVRDRIADLRAQIRSLGPVNEQASTDYEESRERYEFLTGQLADLKDAEAQLREAIDELEGIIRERFRTTFRTVNREFERYFSAFFRGGTARLELGESDEEGLPGIEIIAQPPGKKLGSLALLSGGERSLTAVALLFALLQANPSPICVLDEVDAALDEANVGRFVEALRELSERTQFIIITHNRKTIEIADTIYGVSMGSDSVSRVLGLRLDQVPDEHEG